MKRYTAPFLLAGTLLSLLACGKGPSGGVSPAPVPPTTTTTAPPPATTPGPTETTTSTPPPPPVTITIPPPATSSTAPPPPAPKPVPCVWTPNPLIPAGGYWGPTGCAMPKPPAPPTPPAAIVLTQSYLDSLMNYPSPRDSRLVNGLPTRPDVPPNGPCHTATPQHYPIPCAANSFSNVSIVPLTKGGWGIFTKNWLTAGPLGVDSKASHLGSCGGDTGGILWPCPPKGQTWVAALHFGVDAVPADGLAALKAWAAKTVPGGLHRSDFYNGSTPLPK